MSEQQARDSNGKFAGGAEAQTRNSGRHPIVPHGGRQSVGTHVSGKRIGLGVGVGLLGGLAALANKLGKSR